MREHTGGLTWADFRARGAVRERERQAAHIDTGLFRGSQPAPMATALAHLGGVEALVLGGCCELNSTAHTLITEIGTQLGRLAAEDLGDGLGECIALELHRLRQRVAVRVWSSYQDHATRLTQGTAKQNRTGTDEHVTEGAAAQERHGLVGPRSSHR